MKNFIGKGKIKHKPLTNKQYEKIVYKNDLVDIVLFTGVRIMELKRVIDNYNGKDYVDIKTKKSGDDLNRIFLTKKIMKKIETNIPMWRNKSVRTYSRYFKEISNSELIDFTAHNLRATFATRLWEMGVDILTISTLMNHRDVNQTIKYINFGERKIRESIKLLEHYETIMGYTHQQAIQEILKKNETISKLEEEIRILRKGEENE